MPCWITFPRMRITSRDFCYLMRQCPTLMISLTIYICWCGTQKTSHNGGIYICDSPMVNGHVISYQTISLDHFTEPLFFNLLQKNCWTWCHIALILCYPFFFFFCISCFCICFSLKFPFLSENKKCDLVVYCQR